MGAGGAGGQLKGFASQTLQQEAGLLHLYLK